MPPFAPTKKRRPGQLIGMLPQFLDSGPYIGWESLLREADAYAHAERHRTLCAMLERTEVRKINWRTPIAGRAIYSTRWLMLHESLFEPGREGALGETLWHELAHFFARFGRGARGHGYDWQMATAHMTGGIILPRTHNYPWLNRQPLPKALVYKCTRVACGWEYHAKRHPKRGWLCRECRSRMYFARDTRAIGLENF